VPRFQRFMAAFPNNARVLSRSTVRFSVALMTVPVQIGAAHGQRLGLRATHGVGQIATDEKSNEITAVPKLLEMLSLKNTVVTVDALNCQPCHGPTDRRSGGGLWPSR